MSVLQPREKSIVNSLKSILKELRKLEESESFKGIYYDKHSFDKLKSDMFECINTIIEDSKK